VGSPGERCVEAVARKRRIRIGVFVRIRENNAVKFQSLGVCQWDEEDAFFRELIACVKCGNGAVSGFPGFMEAVFEQGGSPLHMSGACTDDGGEAILLHGVFYSPEKGTGIVVMAGEGPDDRCVTGRLNGGNEDLFLRGQQGGKQGCDLRGGPIAGREGELSDFAVKESVDLFKGGRSFADRLEFIAEQHESGPGIVSLEHHELGGCVVLHFIDHDIAGPEVSLAGQKHLEIEPFEGGQSLFAQKAAADAADIEPLAGIDGIESAAVLAPDAVVLRTSGGPVPCGARRRFSCADGRRLSRTISFPFLVTLPAPDLSFCDLL